MPTWLNMLGGLALLLPTLVLNLLLRLFGYKLYSRFEAPIALINIAQEAVVILVFPFFLFISFRDLVEYNFVFDFVGDNSYQARAVKTLSSYLFLGDLLIGAYLTLLKLFCRASFILATQKTIAAAPLAP
jgi:hypothetical protein